VRANRPVATFTVGGIVFHSVPAKVQSKVSVIGASHLSINIKLVGIFAALVVAQVVQAGSQGWMILPQSAVEFSPRNVLEVIVDGGIACVNSIVFRFTFP